MVECDSFRSKCSGREFNISSSFKLDFSGIVFLLGCKVCVKQYVGNTRNSASRSF